MHVAVRSWKISVAILLTRLAMTERPAFLFHRISVLIQRFNVILLHDSFVKEEEEYWPFQLHIFSLRSIFFLPWELSTGVKK